MSTLDVGQKVVLRDLALPEGVSLVAKDTTLPIVKIMGRVQRGGADAEEAEAGAAAAPVAAKAAAPAAAAGGAAAAKPAAAKPAAK
jgi:hypothetical protein